MALPDYLPGRFALSRGRPRDYFALEHFHYLPRRPATYADVWVVRYHPHLAPPLAAGSPPRCATRALHFDENHPPQAAGLNGLHFADHDALDARWRCDARRDDEHSARLAAVGVLSFPSFRSLPRERTLDLPADLPHPDRLRFVNAHVRTISRVVVHPQFRALGLASELVRTLIAVCPTRYVEASAVMAHVHPFFASAGMRRVHYEESERDDERKPAYFIFDKREGSSCA